ncbi:aminotransferase DegT [Aliifodinibius salipaludis]|uniref:Aminotransferase DegT n=1 Tax=Fodinibius salipaludis TaxID=2032627 RepID=A0A2A2G857_9BACT|nr:DegT/DnrJ/EryC1/StrS family aminotransferase [Aliifodinibius salipaludis]PAU93174.1 aminotransferase DegT [Aliifodinibius salipaludis]
MSKNRKEIPVTKPFLPPREEYEALINEVWERNWLTNNGPLVQRLEEELKEYLGVPHLNYVSNGTIALQIAIKVMELKGEIITTPFSYVATTSSIVWEGCKPVFVDIDPDTLNIDPDLIEEAITDETTGILATHVFGNPCDIDAIQEIADRYNLKVIYDAAHCFGTEYKGESVYSYGDISTASFHATKLFHTTEGGAIITNDAEINHKVQRMRNFGHAGPGNFEGVGINGKNSEFHAAMGIVNLRYIEKVIERRKEQWLYYQNLLSGLKIEGLTVSSNVDFNYSYYPAIFESEKVAINVKDTLEESGIAPRRYFYPSLSELGYVDSRKVEVSKDISQRILCLPLYHDLTEEQQQNIATTIKKTFQFV